MAVRYVRSTDGDNADDGSTWTLAKLDLAGVAAIDTAGDTIWVSDNHAESTAAAISFALAGTVASPIKILCGDDAAEPPNALAETATITTTGNSGIGIGTGASQRAYVYGLAFTSGSGATGTANISIASASTLESCSLFIGTTGASSRVNLQNNQTSSILKNCGFKFSAAGQGLALGLAAGASKIIGGSLLSGGTSPTALFIGGHEGCNLDVDGLDLSNAAAGINLCSDGATNVVVAFRDCKLPASWSGVLHSGTPGAGAIFEMFNCDSADTNYRYRKAAQFGTIQDETTLVRTGGASDGTTTISHKMTTNANAEYPMLTLDSPELHSKWNTTVGSAITATVEFLHDSATALKDNEIWMEAMYLGTSGTPLALFVDDAAADVLATAADQTDSTETWTTTGMANPNTRKMSVTFTPQEAGVVVCVVKVARASQTVYIDPYVVLS